MRQCIQHALVEQPSLASPFCAFMVGNPSIFYRYANCLDFQYVLPAPRRYRPQAGQQEFLFRFFAVVVGCHFTVGLFSYFCLS